MCVLTFLYLCCKVLRHPERREPIKAFLLRVKGARDNFTTQIFSLMEAGSTLAERPVLISKGRVPMDMNGHATFKSDDCA
jgi:hypothetical protein